MSTVPVGLGEMKISGNPEDVLTIYGLGSCIGVGMYDPARKIAGLLHAVLPEGKPGENHSPRYVDSGISSLLEALEEAGASRERLQIRMVGGANLLTAPGHEGTFNIGERNIHAAQAAFSALRLRVRGLEVGGNIGRTMRLYVEDGRTTVRSMGKPERELLDGGR